MKFYTPDEWDKLKNKNSNIDTSNPTSSKPVSSGLKFYTPDEYKAINNPVQNITTPTPTPPIPILTPTPTPMATATPIMTPKPTAPPKPTITPSNVMGTNNQAKKAFGSTPKETEILNRGDQLNSYETYYNNLPWYSKAWSGIKDFAGGVKDFAGSTLYNAATTLSKPILRPLGLSRTEEEQKKDLGSFLGKSYNYDPTEDTSVKAGQFIGNTAGDLTILGAASLLTGNPIAGAAIQGALSTYGEGGDTKDILKGSAANALFMGVASPITKFLEAGGSILLKKTPDILKNSLVADITNKFVAGAAGGGAGVIASNQIYDPLSIPDQKELLHGMAMNAFFHGIPGAINSFKKAKITNESLNNGMDYFYQNINQMHKTAQMETNPVIKANIYKDISKQIDDVLNTFEQNRYVGNNKTIQEMKSVLNYGKENINDYVSRIENFKSNKNTINETSINQNKPYNNFRQLQQKSTEFLQNQNNSGLKSMEGQPQKTFNFKNAAQDVINRNNQVNQQQNDNILPEQNGGQNQQNTTSNFPEYKLKRIGGGKVFTQKDLQDEITPEPTTQINSKFNIGDSITNGKSNFTVSDIKKDRIILKSNNTEWDYVRQYVEDNFNVSTSEKNQFPDGGNMVPRSDSNIGSNVPDVNVENKVDDGLSDSIKNFMNKRVDKDLQRYIEDEKKYGREYNQDEINSSRQRMIYNITNSLMKAKKAIENKDFDVLTSVLNRGNDVSLKLFSEITGLPTGTQKETIESIRSLDPVAYDKWMQEKRNEEKSQKEREQKEAEEKKQKEKQEKYNKIANRPTTYKGERKTFKEWVTDRFNEGYKVKSTNEYGGFEFSTTESYIDLKKFTKEQRSFIKAEYRKYMDKQSKIEAEKEQAEYDALPQEDKDAIDSLFEKGGTKTTTQQQEEPKQEQKEMSNQKQPDKIDTLVDTMQQLVDTIKGNSDIKKLEEKQSEKPHDIIANKVLNYIRDGKKLTNDILYGFADEAYGGTQTQGAYSVKDAHDAMELAVNKYILELPARKGDYPAEETKYAIKTFENILDNLPTQGNNRTTEMEQFQQFSTPPSIAFVASWIANINENDIMLEPSAGIGGLAIFAKRVGATVYANELSKRRLEIIKSLPFDRFFNENAEQLNNILPKDIKASVVVMNPPFSSTAGRTSKNSSLNAGVHIEQALKRLISGGRLVAIVGHPMSDNASQFKDFWNNIKSQYNVRANFSIDGKNYRKYGTTYDIRIVIIDNNGATKTPTFTGTFSDLNEVTKKLEEIRNGRPSVEIKQNSTITGSNEATRQSGSESIIPTPSDTRSEQRNRMPDKTSGTEIQQDGPRPTPSNGTSDNIQQPNGGISAGGNRQGTKTNKTEETETTEVAGIRGEQSQRDDNDIIFKKGNKLFEKETGKLWRVISADKNTGRVELQEVRAKKEGVISYQETSTFYGFPSGQFELYDPTVHKEGRPSTKSSFQSDNDLVTESELENIDDIVKSEIEMQKERENKKENSDDIFSYYEPQKLKIKGTKKHPAILVESAAMGAVEPPDISYVPNLPQQIIENGHVSNAQLEFVSYAGQAHEQIMKDGYRRGIFNGDGTGVGKGTQIAALILDNFRRGRKKAVWISEKKGLVNDAIRDWAWVGQDPKQITSIESIGAKEDININEGILFTTYSTSIMGTSVNNGEIQELDPASRLNQLVRWLGKDFDGVIVFDEAHNMSNALGEDASKTAVVGIKLQELLPKARIAYFSATGATEVHNLAYATRLGLWGKGSPFNDVSDFVTKISEGGLATMELVAKDLKSMGLYVARSISYKEVVYDTLQHDISPVQQEIYNSLAKAWQMVIKETENAMEKTYHGKDSRKKAFILGQLFSSQQRFFNQILTSMSAPTLIKDIRNKLAENKSVVLQLVNTEEAAQNRAVGKAIADEISLDDIEISPKEMLLNYLNNIFPVSQMEAYEVESTDKFGRIKMVTKYRPVKDSEGNPVFNAEIVELRDSLIEDIKDLKTPDSIIDVILNTFGTDAVAEVTGRKKRLVKDLKTGKMKNETRPKNYKESDAAAFQRGDKRILIFSDAGGTGRSYHSSVTAKNQQQRAHYLVQPGWSAPKAMQGFGRTHRSAQVNAPMYLLVTTNIKGQKRFISTIAKRLDQMGALTRGERKASGGMFSAKDNLEGFIAKDTLMRFYKWLFRFRSEEMNINGKDILMRMNLLGKFTDKDGFWKDNYVVGTDTGTFMNRILQLEIAEQNYIFDEYMKQVEKATEIAEQGGFLDLGLENYFADKIEVVDDKIIREDPKTQAKTRYVQLTAYNKTQPIRYERLDKYEKDFIGIYRNIKTGEVRAVYKGTNITLENGNVEQNYKLYSVIQENSTYIEKTLNTKMEKLSNEEGEELWDKAYKNAPEYNEKSLHLFTGTLLPIWDKLPKGNVRVYRVKDNKGNEYLGRFISPNEIDSLLRSFNADRTKQAYDSEQAYDEVIQSGKIIMLENDNIMFTRRRVSGEYRIEIAGDNLRFLTRAYPQIIEERIQWQQRYFVPVSEIGKGIFKQIVESNPIAEISKGSRAEDDAIGGNGTLEQVEAELAKDVDANTPDPERLGITPFGSNQNSKKNKKDTTSKVMRDEVADRFNRAKNIKSPLTDKVLAKIEEIKKNITRGKFAELERGAEYAELRFKLLQFSKGKDIALTRVLENLHGIVSGMKPKEYELFNLKVVFMDLLEDAKAGKPLPYGLDGLSEVEDILRNIESEIADNQSIPKAIEKRNQLWVAMKNEYIKSMKSIGFNVDNRFQKENYFRHLVIEHVQKNRLLTGTGKKLKTPKGSGFLKKRMGSEMDIASDYLQAESEVMAQMMFDMERAKLIKYIETSQHNIISSLKDKAKEMNYIAVVGGIENYNRIQELEGRLAEIKAFGSRTGKEAKEISQELNELDPTRVFKQKIAIGFSKLYKRAENGNLWTGNNGEYEGLVRKLAGYNEDSDIDEGVNPIYSYLSSLVKANTDGSMEAAMILKYTSLRKSFIKETLGDNFKTWEKIIPEGYSDWQADKGNAMYLAYSVPEEIAQKLVDGMIENTAINKSQLRQVLAQGLPHRQMVLPNEVIATIENLMKDEMQTSYIKLLNAWKQWQLLSPRRFLKYNLRNITGDMDHVFLGNPATFKKIPEAMNDLYRVMILNKSMEGNLKDWFERGGMSSFLQVQEMGDINKLKMFIKTAKGKDYNFIRKYWKTVRLSTDFREAILRYATYLSYLEQIKLGGGKPKNYGASIPSEINALKDNRDKAYQLSNDLLGAYDDISSYGERLRKRWIPFYSFMETNMKIYYRTIKNAMNDPNKMATLGRATVVGGKKLSFVTAKNIGRVVLGMFALTAMLEVWNNLFFGDEEEELPENVKKRVHIVLGRDDNGRPIHFTRLGALSDLLEWFGLGTPMSDIKEVLNGRKTLKELIKEMAISPVNKAVNSALPFEKMGAEFLMGQSLFPDVTKPKVIRDRGEYIANSLGLGAEYKAIFGKPTRGYKDSLSDFIVYKSDPKENAYYSILDAKLRFEKQQGKNTGRAFFPDEKSNALYNYKLSLRYKDKEAADKYLNEYIKYGGTKDGYMDSMRSLSPTAGLQDKKDAFIQSLTPEEQAKLEIAQKFYEEMLSMSEFVNGEYAKAAIQFGELRSENDKLYKKMKDGEMKADPKVIQRQQIINRAESILQKANKAAKYYESIGKDTKEIEKAKTNIYEEAAKYIMKSN